MHHPPVYTPPKEIKRLITIVTNLRESLEEDKLRLQSLLDLSSHLQDTLDDLISLEERVKAEAIQQGRDKDSRAGKFKVGDRVEWQVKGSPGVKHRGEIILVVPATKYPHQALHDKFPTQRFNARFRGYYRYEESYLIVDERGQQWWPRVGWLHLI